MRYVIMLAAGIVGFVATGASAAEQRITINIDDSKFEVQQKSPLQAGTPIVIVLRNNDIVQHGFTSPQMVGAALKASGGGLEAFGKGVEGIHVDTGKTAVIRFTPQQDGKFAFRCDLHPQMKGELYELEVLRGSGGG